MRPIPPARRGRLPILAASLLAVLAATAVADAPGPDSTLVKLLKSGRVPEERQATIVEMIGRRGTPADLAYIFQRAARPGGFSDSVRLKALDALADAASTRKARPEGDLGPLRGLLRPEGPKPDAAARRAAARLAGLWKAEPLGDDLRAIAQAPDSGPPLRAAALDALVAIGGPAGRASIEALDAPDRPKAIRIQAVAALAALDLDAAAGRAAALLRDAAEDLDLAPMLAAFLNRRGGADKLAAALAGQQPPAADAAKLALRAMYALGQADPALVAPLSRAAGIDADPGPLDKPALDRLVAEVLAKGDPARGEDVFRRADVNCLRCHSVAGAGGDVGPDLSPVGSSSPVDYLINSILVPDQAIKEVYQAHVVLTDDGRVFQGIIVDKDDARLVLKEATGDRRVIPTSEIEETRPGGSLMPRGLGNLMTHAEFLDLVRFLSELGKPGPYAIRATPTVQRWRVLKPVPDDLAGSDFRLESFRTEILGADEAHWLPAYAKVSGALPLDELTALAGGPLLYLQGEIDVTAPGPITVRLDSPEGARAWLDDQAAPPGATFTADLARGRHKLTLRVDARARKAPSLKVEVLKAAGSPAEFTVVGGR